jgi:dihydrofolate reductase
MTLGLIWAQSTARVIGRDGTLPWHLPEDLAHFRAVTSGHPVIMGRRTWDSLPDRFRPLPGRRNIVVSRQSDLVLAGADVAGSVEDAVVRAGPGESWVIGGAEIYAAALPLATVAVVTKIDVDVVGDAHAPDLTGWMVETCGDWRKSTTGLRYRIIRYRPKT